MDPLDKTVAWGSARNALGTRSMQRRKMANLVVDTIDGNGQPVLPERVTSVIPRLKSYLSGLLLVIAMHGCPSFMMYCGRQEYLLYAGYWQLSVTDEDLAARESFHTHAFELSDAWMSSPGDMSMDDAMYGFVFIFWHCPGRLIVPFVCLSNHAFSKYVLTDLQPSFRLFSHWQAHHRHTCQHGDTWHAQWLSFNDSGHCDPDTGSSPFGTADGIRHETSCAVICGRRTQKTKSLLCHVGLAPPGYAGGVHDSPLAVWHFQVPTHMCFSSGDVSSDSWESFLLLLSENASFLEDQNTFPNRLQHGSRVIHSMTLERAIGFVANPTVSEVRFARR